MPANAIVVTELCEGRLPELSRASADEIAPDVGAQILHPDPSYPMDWLGLAPGAQDRAAETAKQLLQSVSLWKLRWDPRIWNFDESILDEILGSAGSRTQAVMVGRRPHP